MFSRLSVCLSLYVYMKVCSFAMCYDVVDVISREAGAKSSRPLRSQASQALVLAQALALALAVAQA